MKHHMTEHTRRADALRGRVQDAVRMLGHGDEEYGLKQFAKRALEYAERHQLRTWKVTERSRRLPEDLARNSLSNFLRLRPTATGRSDRWVLDLWEGVLHEMHHGVDRRRERPEDPGEQQAEAAMGVQPFKAERSLAMRVLDAFTDRDAATMLDLALEIEQLEVRGQR